MEANLIVNTAAAPDFKYGWTAPIGASMDWFGQEFANVLSIGSIETISGGANTFSAGTIRGTIYNSSVIGSVAVVWSQNTNTPSSVTTLLKGSNIIAHRLQ